MKRILYFLFYVLCMNHLLAQQTITLSSQTSGVYKARDYIKLLPGFRSSAASTGNFTAAIDRQLVMNTNYLTADQVASLRQNTANPQVGSTAGSFNVSSTGGASYTVPITVPPGPGGLQPNFAITYNSQLGNSLLGMGMNLAGLSVITRAPSTIYYDGTTKPIQADVTDNYALDGARLLLVAGNNGTPNAEYRTESENFAKVVIKDANNYGGKWFEITTKEGITYRYGSNGGQFSDPNNGEVTLSWYLDYVQDANGNYMQYSYRTDNNVVYLDKINYGGNTNTGTACSMAVQMIYDTRTDQIDTHYISRLSLNGQTYNLKGKASLLLSQILVLFEGNTIRRYEASYASDLFTRLVAIREKGQNNEQYYPTIFSWNAQKTASDIASQTITLGSSNIDNNAIFLTADLNGDGISDIITLNQQGTSSSNYSVVKHLSTFDNGQVTFSAVTDNALPYNNNRSIMLTPLPLTLHQYGQYDSKQTLLIPVYFYYGNYLPIVTFYAVKEKTESPFSAGYELSVFTRFTLSANDEAAPITATADLDNDGKEELIVVTQNGKLAIYDGTTWRVQNIDVNVRSGYLLTELRIADFNGDGLLDMCLVNGQGNCSVYLNKGGSLDSLFYSDVTNARGEITQQIAANWSIGNPACIQLQCDPYDAACRGKVANQVCLSRIGDFNGDGFPDFLFYNYETKQWCIGLNDGNGAFSFTKLNSLYISWGPSQSEKNFNCIVHDFDGDGKSDIVLTTPNYDLSSGSSTIYYTGWFKSIGSDFQLTKYTLGNSTGSLSICKQATLGIFDSDGHIELFFRGFDLSATFLNSFQNRVYKNAGYTLSSGLLSHITNGLGTQTTIEYNSPVDKSLYTKIASTYSQLNDYTFNMPAVSKSTISGNNTLNINYSYAGARVHLQKGFLGFQTTTAKQVEQGITSQTITDLNLNWFVPSKVTNKITYSDGSAESNIVSFNFTNAGAKRYVQLPVAKTNQDVDGNTVTTNYTYDTYSNLLTEKSDYGNNMYRQIAYSGYTAAGSYLPNKPQLVTTTWKHPDDGSKFIVQTTLAYDPTHGYVIKKTDNAQSNEKQVTTTYSDFDGWGNPKTVKVMPAGMAATTESFEYHPTGRFATKHVTPLGYVTATYDAWGHALTSTDDLSRTTTNIYDGLGRLTATYYPDRRTSTQTMGWGANANQCYYSLSQSSGEPWVKTWYDNLGRETKTESVGIKSTAVTSGKTYNSKGQLESTSFAEGTINTSCTYQYDNLGRVTTETYNNGKTMAYSYGNRTVSTAIDGKTTKKVMDAWGNPLKVTDPDGNSVNYTYYSNNQPHIVTAVGAQWSMAYDEVGNQTQLVDPNVGSVTYQYNALGQVIRQNTSKNATAIIYDSYDRVQTKIINGTEATTYEYVADGDGKGQVKSITGPKGNKINYGYDSFNRLVSEARLIGGESFSFGYGYDSNGNLVSTVYPTGYTVNRMYDSYGFADKITADGSTLWQLRSYCGGGLSGLLADGKMMTEIARHSDGHLMTLATHLYPSEPDEAYEPDFDIRNFYHSFDHITNNLNVRQDGVTGESDIFKYDRLDRLISSQHYGSNPSSISIMYDPNGNIASKSNAGGYLYDGGLPHAVTKVQDYTSVIPNIEQKIDYTSFDKVMRIKEKLNELIIDYAPDEERAKTVLSQNGSPQKTVIFDGDYERETFANGTVRHLHYIALNDGVFAIMVRSSLSPCGGAGGGCDSMYYVHPDHLGSYTVVTDAQANIKERATYDPWGIRTITEGKLIFSRGFTGHEHLAEFNLINMNGRCYDPVLGRFLSPDPYIQAPDFSQSFNRYSYCVNNPLKYRDPSGNIFGIDDALFAFIMVSSTWLGGAQAGQAAQAKGQSWFSGFMQGATTSAISTAFSMAGTYGVGTAFGHTVSGVGNELLRAGAHGINNGLIDMVQGGSFGNGFATGAVASLAGSAGQAIGLGPLGVVGAATLAGAGASALTGGNWMDGAMQGMSIGMFNHEWSIDRNTGSIEKISDVGDNDWNAYYIGDWSDNHTAFTTAKTIFVNGSNTINSFRFWQSSKSTLSAFCIASKAIVGYFLERPGPSTTKSGLSLRIPQGSYHLIPNTNRFPGCYMLGNNDVSFERGITVHIGNFPRDTHGCLLPGTAWSPDMVSGSGLKLKQINSFIRNTGYKNVQFNIFDIF